MKKLVLFGAGKIGRSFIGQLFSQSGYEVVFVDVNQQIIQSLNKHRKYKVVIKSEKEEVLYIENVRGILASDIKAIQNEITDADILAVSVGQRGLPHVLPVIAQSLVIRYGGNKRPLDIIIAENMRNADVFIKNELTHLLPATYPFSDMVGLVETSIGKMVPLMPKEEEEKDILQVFAEPYNTLILDKKGFKNPVPEVKGIDAKENMKAWVDCKAYIHNFGHAATAYAGYLHDPESVFLYEALEHKVVHNFVQKAMFQAADILQIKYPGEFTNQFIKYHIDDLLHRFKNKALGDTIFRVGCDLTRKLGVNDRIMSPLRDGLAFGLPVDKILQTLVFGYHFRAKDENGNMLHEDTIFVEKLKSAGFNEILSKVSGLTEPDLIKDAAAIYVNPYLS